MSRSAVRKHFHSGILYLQLSYSAAWIGIISVAKQRMTASEMSFLHPLFLLQSSFVVDLTFFITVPLLNYQSHYILGGGTTNSLKQPTLL